MKAIKSIALALTLSMSLVYSLGDSASALRFASVSSGQTTLKVKEGGSGALWKTLVNNNAIIDLSVTDTRVAYIDTGYRLWVKEGGLSSQWVLVANNVGRVELQGNRIFVIDLGYKLRVKEGPLNAGWVDLQYDVVEVKVSSTRVLTLSDYDGYTTRLAVKAGSLNAQWQTLAYPVSSYNGSYSSPSIAVTDTRIAYLEGDYDGFRIKEGSIYSSWYDYVYMEPAFEIALSGDRLCINRAAGISTEIICKEGPLYAQFYKMHDNAFMTDMTQDKLTIRTYLNNPSYPNNALMFLEGRATSNTGWKVLDQGLFLGISK